MLQQPGTGSQKYSSSVRPSSRGRSVDPPVELELLDRSVLPVECPWDPRVGRGCGQLRSSTCEKIVRRARDVGPAAAPAVAAPSPDVLARRRAGRAARGHDPHAAARRQPAARARLPDRRRHRPARRLPARRGRLAAAAAARRRRGRRGRGRAAHRRGRHGGRPRGGRRRRAGEARTGAAGATAPAGRRRCRRRPSRSPRARPDVDAGSLLVIAQACRGLERLRFTYRDRVDRVTERTVEPYRLVHTGRRWYLVARDVRAEAWRTFRVDRMVEPRHRPPLHDRRPARRRRPRGRGHGRRGRTATRPASTSTRRRRDGAGRAPHGGGGGGGRRRRAAS